MEELEDIFQELGIEIELENDDDFLKVKETLTRIGVSSRKENKLYQSCHILHKRGRYTIVRLLEEWGLISILEGEEYEEPQVSLAQIKILPYKEKEDWELIPKYHIGNT